MRVTLWDGDDTNAPGLAEIVEGYWEGRWWVRCDCRRPASRDAIFDRLWQEGEQRLLQRRAAASARGTSH